MIAKSGWESIPKNHGGRIGLRACSKMDYEEEFAGANARRQLFGKKPLPFHKSQKWFLDPNTLNGMVYAIRGETEKYTAEEMAGNCASVSIHLGPVIGKFLGTDAIFTLGYFGGRRHVARIGIGATVDMGGVKKRSGFDAR